MTSVTLNSSQNIIPTTLMPDQYTNGTCQESIEEEGRQPSYVRLSRCLSGYATLNYDPSKQVIGRSPSPMRPSQEIVESTPPPAPMEEPVSTSFIEQRIERLYGPGALAQVFYSRSPAARMCKTPQESRKPSVDVENSKSVPVMKLLRPEFRAQLTSASPISPSLVTPKRPSKNITKDSVDACNPTARTLIMPQSPEAKDGHHYLKKLDEEIKGLERVAIGCEAELTSCKSENGCGILRAISGKARLLIAEKLNQFRGLCLNNINQSNTEDFPTTCEDLAGFWDMVMIQVVDVHSQFKRIDTLKKNNWTEEDISEDTKAKNPLRPGPTKSKAVSSNSKVQSEASKARDAARRKMLQERRQAMKQQTAPEPSPSDAQQPSTSLFII